MIYYHDKHTNKDYEYKATVTFADTFEFNRGVFMVKSVSGLVELFSIRLNNDKLELNRLQSFRNINYQFAVHKDKTLMIY